MKAEEKVIVHQSFIIDLKVLQHEIDQIPSAEQSYNNFKEDEIDGDKQTTVAHALMRMCIKARQHGLLFNDYANEIMKNLNIPLSINGGANGFYIEPI